MSEQARLSQPTETGLNPTRRRVLRVANSRLSPPRRRISRASDSGLKVAYVPVGRGGKVTARVTLDGEPIVVESFDLTKKRARDAFVDQVYRRHPGVDRTALEQDSAEEGRRANESSKSKRPESLRSGSVAQRDAAGRGPGGRGHA